MDVDAASMPQEDIVLDAIHRDTREQRETARGHNFADARELPTEDGAHWVHQAEPAIPLVYRASRGITLGSIHVLWSEARTDVRVLGIKFIRNFVRRILLP